MAPTKTPAKRTKRPDTFLAEQIDAALKAADHPKLDTLARQARRRGDSWEILADDVRDKTGLPITSESLRRWYRDLPAAA